ncbi:hypothetical protein PENTCL1PPCAC_18811, partial [Pristionchus entomophagus]
CDSMGDSLPILTTEEVSINQSFLKFAQLYLAEDSIWIGLICDPDNEAFMWQDGQTLDYSAISDDPGIGYNEPIAPVQGVRLNWKAYQSKAHFTYCVCARR